MNREILVGLFLLCILQFQAAFAGVDECKHRIIFLPQKHPSAFEKTDSSPDAIEPIAKSQFKIAKYILEHKDVPIFSEQVDTTLTAQDLENSGYKSVTQKYRKLFQNGLTSYEELNPEQKQRLAEAGADATLLMLRKIPILHKVVPNRQIQDQIFAETAEKFKKTKSISIFDPIFRVIDDKREILALEEINKYFNDHPTERDVNLIYGNRHQFARHPDVFPPNCILVPFSFQKDHTTILRALNQDRSKKGIN